MGVEGRVLVAMGVEGRILDEVLKSLLGMSREWKSWSHSLPLSLSFYSKKKGLPWVGFEPTTLHFLGMSALPIELPLQLSR